MKISLFKAVNIFMLLFCAGSFYINYSNVNIVDNNKAISKINENVFEYNIVENSFTFSKNDKLVGIIPMNSKPKFRKTILPKFCCNILTGGIATAVIGGVLLAANGVIAGKGGYEIGKGIRKNDKNRALNGVAVAASSIGGVALVTLT